MEDNSELNPPPPPGDTTRTMNYAVQHRGAQRAQIKRIIIAISIGIIATVASMMLGNGGYHPGGDFALWPLPAAREIIAGREPYNIDLNGWIVPYPLTAALIAMPFTPFSNITAAAIFFGFSSALMALALTRDNQYWRLIAFASLPYFYSLVCTQWGPFMVAAAFYPHLLPVTLAKPHIGIAAAVFKRPTKIGVLLSVSLVAATLIIDPAWPVKWIGSITHYQGTIPVLYPFGFILLLALLRWKEPGARLILLSALLPKRDIYDYLLLWCIPDKRKAMLITSLLSWFAWPLMNYSQSAALLFYFIPLVVLLKPILLSTLGKYRFVLRWSPGRSIL